MTLTETLDPVRRSAPVNMRDLGGIGIRGGAVRRGFAIRADDLALADEASARTMVDRGLTTIIDLRSADELAVTGRGPLGSLPVTYHHVPLMANLDQAAAFVKDPEAMIDQAQFGAMYIHMFESSAPQIVTAMAILAHAPGAVAFHCTAGQDRTGVLAAAVLLALGAESERIVADYARTGPNSAAIRTRTQPVIGPLMARLGVDLDFAARAALRTEFSPLPMEGLLNHLTRNYANPLRPLEDAGLTESLLAQLHARALRA